MVRKSPIERAVYGSGESLPCAGKFSAGKLFASDHHQVGEFFYFEIERYSHAFYGRLSLAMEPFTVKKQGELSREQKQMITFHDAMNNDGPMARSGRETEYRLLLSFHFYSAFSKVTDLSVAKEQNGRRLKQFLRAHPGVVLEIWGPGAREACAHLRTYFQTYLPGISSQKNEVARAPVALVHVIQVLRCQEAAEDYQKCFQVLKP